jgi:dTDP-4-amino-4,6-dideoxygalactose transaminase
LDLHPGDEVILPSLTFVATANAVRYTGASPIFADIQGETDLNISPVAIEAKITPQTRAIIVVHYGGYPCDMQRILEIADRHHLVVIEDAAHAPGSALDGRGLGSWGRVGCFSFFSNKNMTTGEGGMLTTNHSDVAQRLRLMRSHGMTTLTWDRHKGHAFSYDVVGLGYNYRIDEIRAAIGRCQLARLPGSNHRRRELSRTYWQRLNRETPEILTPFSQHAGVSASHLMPVLLPPGADRKIFMEEMKALGIQTSIHYPPIHTFTDFRSLAGFAVKELSLTENVAEREVTLPLFGSMTDAQVDQVVAGAVAALATSTHRMARGL